MEKLASRKLWVTLGGVASIVALPGLAWWQQVIAAALVAVYVLAQGWADSRQASNPLDTYGDAGVADLEQVVHALKLGLEKAKAGEFDPTAGDVGGIRIPAIKIPFELVQLIIQTIEKLIPMLRKKRT